MKEWCLQHPYLTFFLILAVVITVCDIGLAVTNRKKQ